MPVVERSSLSWSAILKVVLAIFLPPAAVIWHQGCTIDLLWNVLLTFLGWIPGMIHAMWILTKPSKLQVSNV